MPEPEPPVDRERSPLRRLLSRVDRWASRPLTALIVIAADMAWVLSSVALGFPGQGERMFQTLVAALTLAIVFVIQHTQAREQAATQRKLDEILQALPGADDSLLMLEHASHDEVRATSDAHREIRAAALDGQSGAATPAGGPPSESGGPARGALSCWCAATASMPSKCSGYWSSSLRGVCEAGRAASAGQCLCSDLGRSTGTARRASAPLARLISSFASAGIWSSCLARCSTPRRKPRGWPEYWAGEGRRRCSCSSGPGCSYIPRVGRRSGRVRRSGGRPVLGSRGRPMMAGQRSVRGVSRP